MKRIGFALMLAALPSLASAQTPDCMPQAQASALVTFALPTLVEKLGQRCGEVLPPNAYIVANAGALADRYAPDSAAAWPQARRAIGMIFPIRRGIRRSTARSGLIRRNWRSLLAASNASGRNSPRT